LREHPSALTFPLHLLRSEIKILLITTCSISLNLTLLRSTKAAWLARYFGLTMGYSCLGVRSLQNAVNPVPTFALLSSGWTCSWIYEKVRLPHPTTVNWTSLGPARIYLSCHASGNCGKKERLSTCGVLHLSRWFSASIVRRPDVLQARKKRIGCQIEATGSMRHTRVNVDDIYDAYLVDTKDCCTFK
jgi:hypothetical protein